MKSLNKNVVNSFLSHFGLEIHGLGYMKRLKSLANVEKPIYKAISLIKKERPVIFDVGANKGIMIDVLLKKLRHPRIYAFEPIPELAGLLNEKFAGKSQVVIKNEALSNFEGKRSFNINKSLDTSSFRESISIGASSDKQCITTNSIEVQTSTLDIYTGEKGIAVIDMLKLDVQGSELEVLKGGEKLLTESRIDTILTEVYFKQQYKDQPLFIEIYNYLEAFGYKMFDLMDPYYSNKRLLWADALFVRE